MQEEIQHSVKQYANSNVLMAHSTNTTTNSLTSTTNLNNLEPTEQLVTAFTEET